MSEGLVVLVQSVSFLASSSAVAFLALRLSDVVAERNREERERVPVREHARMNR